MSSVTSEWSACRWFPACTGRRTVKAGSPSAARRRHPAEQSKQNNNKQAHEQETVRVYRSGNESEDQPLRNVCCSRTEKPGFEPQPDRWRHPPGGLKHHSKLTCPAVTPSRGQLSRNSTSTTRSFGPTNTPPTTRSPPCEASAPGENRLISQAHPAINASTTARPNKPAASLPSRLARPLAQQAARQQLPWQGRR